MPAWDMQGSGTGVPIPSFVSQGPLRLVALLRLFLIIKKVTLDSSWRNSDSRVKKDWRLGL